MPETPPKLAKPMMKGLLKRQITINVATAITLGIITGILFNTFLYQPHKQKFADYYKDYDPENEMMLMMKMGADFQSSPDFK